MSKKPKKKNNALSKTSGSAVTRQSIAFSGPLPPPVVLEGYKQVDPEALAVVLQLARQAGDNKQAIIASEIKLKQEEQNNHKRA